MLLSVLFTDGIGEADDSDVLDNSECASGIVHVWFRHRDVGEEHELEHVSIPNLSIVL